MDVVVVDDTEAVGARVAALIVDSVDAGSRSGAGRGDGCHTASRLPCAGPGRRGLRLCARGRAGRVRRAAGRASGVVRRLRGARDRVPAGHPSGPRRGAAGERRGARAQDRRAGRGRRAAARDRPQRAPGLQRAGVSAGLAEPGRRAHRDDASRQRGVPRRRAGPDPRRDPGTRHDPRGPAPRAARQWRFQVRGRRRCPGRTGDARLPGVGRPAPPAVTVVLDAAAASGLQRRGSLAGPDRERVHHPQL